MQVSFVPRVIVKFKDDLIDPQANDSADRFLAELIIESAWIQLAAQPQFQGITITRLLTAVPQPRLLNLINKARRQDPTYDPPNLLAYFSIPCPPNVKPEALVKVLSAPPWSNTVQLAYLAGAPAEDPAVSKGTNLGWNLNETDFLRAAPKGINAEYAWSKPGGDGGKGDGVNLQFFDIESNWDLTHPDLATDNTLNHSGPQEPDIGHIKKTDWNIDHGTAVLGIVIASDGNPIQQGYERSSLGITPHVAVTKIFSYWLNLSTPAHANTILAAIDKGLIFGDVLLLEFQITVTGEQNQPGELQKDIFDAIRLATALGIVVVEAAGNGGKDLDTWPDFYWGLDSSNKPVYFSPNRGSPHYKDSGAILVSAATSMVPHDPVPGSFPSGRMHNFGSRIDCYAWGEDIYTTLSNNPYGTVDGTSGAAAIIAGAALSLQGLAEARPNGYRLSPPQIRQLLSDPTTGTLIGSSFPPPNSPLPSVWNDKKLGVMPDLKTIVETSLGNSDIYIRDSVGDNGDPGGPIGLSPDIILRRESVADPDAEFGEYSMNKDTMWLSETAVSGKDNYIYVRVRNRGFATATNVSALVYWSDLATLVIPSMWNLIGRTGIANVPPNDDLTVLPPITWSAAAVPGPGHYCFVATIGNREDPPPPTPADFVWWDPATAWQRYERFIRVNNNVAWVSVVVVGPLKVEHPPGPHVLPYFFYICGPWSQAASMQFEVMSQLPAEARLSLLITDEDWTVLSTMGELGPIEPIAMEENKAARAIRLTSNGRSRTREMMIPQNFRAKCQLLVDIPERFQKYPYEVSIRQLSRDQEVGRITWRLAPELNGGQR